MSATREKSGVNRSLISLKIVVFLIISGLTALHVLHSAKPFALGLNFDEYRTINIIAPLISIIGPLIVGPLADRIAAKNANNYGGALRFLIAVCLIISGIVNVLLVTVPEVQRAEARRPLVSFGCDSNGAIIFQERCSDEATCHHWKEKVGSVNLTKCTYTCQDPTQYESMYKPWLEHVPTPSPSTEHSSEFEYEDDITPPVTESLRSRRSADKKHELSAELGGNEVMSAEEQHTRSVRQLKSLPNKVYVEPPHLCITGKDENGQTIVKNCHVYTDDTPNIVVHSVLRAATNVENDTHSAEWCNYPLDGFQCQIPLEQVNYMIGLKNGSECKPMIECQVINPYDSKESVLADSECIKTIGDLDTTLTWYTIIRILGDIFELAALTLLNTAIVIAVRETSEGRGEVCRQYVWGAIGYVLLFAPIHLYIFPDGIVQREGCFIVLIIAVVCFLLGAIVIMLPSNMPLSPPEWWWHTKTGMVVYPMSAIRRYSPEIFILTIVALSFGIFWSSIHSYLLWNFNDPYAVTYVGLLLVLALFFNVDKFIEYCGHSNIFIAGFALFIIRFTALSGKEVEWLSIVMETLEPLIIGVIWITIILYMRHAMPRKFTATGQAVIVIAFFGLGKSLGALIGLARDEKSPAAEAQNIHQWLAIAAAVIALFYFIIYNLILAPRCTAKPQHLDDLISGSASQNFSNGANGNNGTAAGGAGSAGAALNGSGNNYSQLRVYHNERGKKGQFRY